MAGSGIKWLTEVVFFSQLIPCQLPAIDAYAYVILINWTVNTQLHMAFATTSNVSTVWMLRKQF